MKNNKVNNDFTNNIEKQEFRTFLGLIFSILFVPVLTFLILRNFFDNQTTPAFITLGVIIFLKFTFIIYILFNQNNLNNVKKNE